MVLPEQFSSEAVMHIFSPMVKKPLVYCFFFGSTFLNKKLFYFGMSEGYACFINLLDHLFLPFLYFSFVNMVNNKTVFLLFLEICNYLKKYALLNLKPHQ